MSKKLVGAVTLCMLGAAWAVTPALAQDAAKPATASEAGKDTRPSGAVPQMHDDGDVKRMERRANGEARMPVGEDTADLEAALPGPPRDRRWMDAGRGRPDLSPEMIDRLMEVVRDLDADRAAKLEELRTSDPKQFSVVVARSGRHLLGLSMLKDRDPELYSIRIDELRKGQEISRIAQEIRAARDTCSDEELERLTTMLRNRIREQTDLNFRARGRELILLEQHIKTTREKLVEDINNRNDAIEKRLTELLADHEEHEHDAFAADRASD